MAAKKEIYTYQAPWPVYATAASHSTEPSRLQRCGRAHALHPRRKRAPPTHTRPSPSTSRYCFGSFIEEYSNKLQIIQLDDEKGEFVVRSTMDHPYPATRIQWAPEPLCSSRDMLATSGDYLRLWTVGPDGEAKQEVTLNNVRAACPPPLPPSSPRVTGRPH